MQPSLISKLSKLLLLLSIKKEEKELSLLMYLYQVLEQNHSGVMSVQLINVTKRVAKGVLSFVFLYSSQCLNSVCLLAASG